MSKPSGHGTRQLGSSSQTSEMTGAETEIRNRISLRGSITFAEFMELALYHPEGYYSEDSRIGARGDYFTSPVLHPAFGALLAVQLRVMWDTLGRPSAFWIVEPGARDGQLATDILSFADAHMDEFARALRYVEIDRSSLVLRHATISPPCLASAGFRHPSERNRRLHPVQRAIRRLPRTQIPNR